MSYVLNKLVGIDSVIINISSGDQVTGKLDELKNHFEVYGTPIMIGNLVGLTKVEVYSHIRCWEFKSTKTKQMNLNF